MLVSVTKYTREDPVPVDGRRAKFDFPPVDIEKGYDVVVKLKELCDKYEASVAQVALAWLLAKPFVSTVLIGATNIQQLKENLGKAELKLAEEDIRGLDELTEVAAPYPIWMQGMGWDAQVKEALGEN